MSSEKRKKRFELKIASSTSRLLRDNETVVMSAHVLLNTDPSLFALSLIAFHMDFGGGSHRFLAVTNQRLLLFRMLPFIHRAIFVRSFRLRVLSIASIEDGRFGTKKICVRLPEDGRLNIHFTRRDLAAANYLAGIL